jgi:hypothetical protein
MGNVDVAQPGPDRRSSAVSAISVVAMLQAWGSL